MSAIAAALAAPGLALANPTGGIVVDGAAAISAAGSVTNVAQSTNRAIINWQSFSIGLGETVNFYQPSPLAVTLNRVVGNEQSVIAGALNANGRVFLVNSAGILLTKDAQVNVGGLVASTLDITNANFISGNHVFSGSSSATVVNQGHIKASDGGYVALLGKTVSNEGTITAKLGAVALASGEQITLNFGGDSLLDVTVDKGTLNALVENKGAIKANGGAVVLTAKAADDLLSAQVNNSGVIRARSIADLTGGSSSQGTVKVGRIKLLASGGTVNVSGRLDASAPKGGRGGTIDTSGNRVTIADKAVITTKSATGENGSWIIDPDGFAIAATGGDITGSTLSSQLASNNVTIVSTSGSGAGGDIDVNDVVSWAANTTLTLNATNAINVNAVLTGSGASSGLTLKAGSSVNVNAPSSLQVASLTATAGGDVSVNAPQLWTNAGAWTFAGKNINVNDTIGWSAGVLTLNAASFINLNAVMTASNTGSLVAIYNPNIDTTVASGVAAASYGTPLGGFNPLFDSATGTYLGRIDFVSNTAANPLTINGNKYKLITSVSQLDLLDTIDATKTANASSISGFYALAANLDACGAVSATCASAVTYNYSLLGIGSGAILDGLGHNIANVTITGDTPQGFINANSGTIQNLSLTNLSETAKNGTIGGIVATNASRMFNVSVSGTLNVPNATATPTSGWTIASPVGGLVGLNGGIIYGAHSNVNITAFNATNVGGLVGRNFGRDATHTTGIILNSTSSGNVTVTEANSNIVFIGAIGGFVGDVFGGSVYNSSSSGTVSVSTQDTNFAILAGVGAFAGNIEFNRTGSIVGNSFTTGNVNVIGGSVHNVGGFAGIVTNSAVSGSSSFGSITTPTTQTTNVPNNIDTVGGFAGGVFGSRLTGNSFSAALDRSVVGGGSSTGITSATATEPTAGQGASPSNAAQAAAARASATSLTLAATAQQQAVATVTRAVAQRAAETRLAASTAGNVVANNSQLFASAAARSASATAAGRRAAQALAAPTLDDVVTGEEPAQTQLPAPRAVVRHASAAPSHHKAHPATSGAGFGARIRSIDVDGHHFDLGNSGRNSAPAPKAK
ncbi:MAG TPA: filamentous hemagglutinin N-terminal domain-containing protein [Methylosinus sp.]|jgi:filamentous hemagglutinin family protein|uniref:beta strand repeat-containing protein n=1 Tax=Methylosinus sp. TaxID=427 RepID=UPI002F9471FA